MLDKTTKPKPKQETTIIIIRESTAESIIQDGCTFAMVVGILV